MSDKFKEVDKTEMQLPETVFSRDVETKVFQAIAFQCLAKIEGIQLVSKGLIDSLLGRDAQESYSAIHVEQDQKKHSVSIKVEVNIKFGISIPAKSKEIQEKIIEAISSYTGMHVSCVHVVFKSIIMESSEKDDDEDEQLQAIADTEEEYETF